MLLIDRSDHHAQPFIPNVVGQQVDVVDRDLAARQIEAAELDGAGKWATFWNVTWPQLMPTTFFIVVMTFIAGIQGGFEQAKVMTDGKPAGTTPLEPLSLYEGSHTVVLTRGQQPPERRKVQIRGDETEVLEYTFPDPE